jgi:hypothetical protein
MQKKSHSAHGRSGRVFSLLVLLAAESSFINVTFGAGANRRHNTSVLLSTNPLHLMQAISIIPP